MSNKTTGSASAEADPPFKPLHGECMCGSVKYNILSAPAGKPGLCHCNDCKRTTGSMFSSNVQVPRSALKITGPYKVWSREENKNKNLDISQQYGGAFCPSCGTQFAAFPDEPADTAVIRIGTLDPEDLARLERPTWEIFCKRKVGWQPAGVEGAGQYEEWPIEG